MLLGSRLGEKEQTLIAGKGWMGIGPSLKSVGIPTLPCIVIQLFWGLGSWLLVMGSNCTTPPFLPEDILT
jgi:hypothetical protein